MSTTSTTSTTSIMKNIMSLITTVIVVAVINVAVNVMCSTYGCYHWSNAFNHDLICHGCINVAKYMKDFQMMTYMGVGTILVKEINGLIQSVNDNLFHYHKEEAKTSPKRIPEQASQASQASHNVSDYPLGRKSPRPFWREVVPNTHD